MLAREEKLKYGFSLAEGYCLSPKERRSIYDYANMERYVIDRVFVEDITPLLYGEKFEKRPRYLIIPCPKDLGEGNELIYREYLLRLRGMEIIYMDGSALNETASYMAEREKEIRLDRMSHAREERAKKGLVSNGRQTYGYYDKEGRLNINEYEAFVVRFIFFRRAQGCSYYMIAKELNQRGFKTRKGTDFYPAFIKGVEERKGFYQGTVTYHGKNYRGQHTPLLSKDEECLWGEVFEQKVMDKEQERKLKKYRDKLGNSVGRPPSMKPFIVIKEERRYLPK